jgi:hypothetical protein
VKLLKMNTDSCLLYSAAMLLDADPLDLIEEIGHDGMDKWWPTLDPPLCYRSHHIQEIIDCCASREFGLCPIEIMPCLIPQGQSSMGKIIYTDPEYGETRFEYLIKGRPGILIGMSSNGTGHAAAWDGSQVYDPNGSIYDLELFQIRECWILTKLI